MSATVEVSVRPNGFDPSEEDSVTVLLADHDGATRLGLREALEAQGFSVVAEASDAHEAVGAALQFRPTVCLLDMSMPGGGANAAAEILPMLPDTRIAILGTDASVEGEVMEALHAGADGYLLKETAPERMNTALRALLRGEAVLPRALTARLVLELRCAAAANDTMPARSRLRYLPRLTHHYRRRRASGMSRVTAWRSARVRMRDYR